MIQANRPDTIIKDREKNTRRLRNANDTTDKIYISVKESEKLSKYRQRN